MEDRGGGNRAPSRKVTVEHVFNDFQGRRNGIIKALTTDVREFARQCKPVEQELCLYGLPDERWEVRVPEDLVPSNIPEPRLGINYDREEMKKKDWLSSVAFHSDSWLLSYAFFIGIKAGFVKDDRKKLFDLINELPTVYEVFNGFVKKRSNSKERKSGSQSYSKQPEPVDEKGNHEQDKCGECGELYEEDEFWICCDFCEKWYHGPCVKITPAIAEHIDKYKCPLCLNK